MRRIIFLFTGLCLFLSSFAITKPIERPPVKANQVYLPIGKNGERISLMDLSTIKARDLEKLTGKKMSLFDKIGFKISQKKLRAGIRSDGSFKNKKLQKAFDGDGTTGFHIGGFALGFLLGLIGILIAYLINDGKKRNRVKWAWIGLLAWIVLVLALFI